LLTTYQMKSNDLDSKVIESIKSNFPNEDIVIDVYPASEFNSVINEITNPEIISRIKDIENNKNIVIPNLSFNS